MPCVSLQYDLKSQLAAHCIMTAPPKLNGSTLVAIILAFAEPGDAPFGALRVLCRCAAADDSGVQLRSMSRENVFDHVDEDEAKLSADKLHIFN